MTRKELSQVYRLRRELHMWEERIAELRNKSMTTAKDNDGMPFANTNEVSDTTFNYISKIMELQAEIDEHRLRIEAEISKIEKYIITLDDCLLRQIIEYHCCQCKTWRDTARMIGAGTTEDSIRMYFNRRFPKI